MFFFRVSVLLIAFSSLSHNLVGQPTELLPRQPEWTHKTISNYIDGSVHSLVLVDSAATPKKLITYYPNGALLQEVDLGENGLKNGAEVSFSLSGKIQSYQEWKNGFLHGVSQEYSDTGTLLIEAHFMRGLLYGTRKEWNEDATLISLSHYLQGMLHGTKECYFPNGKVKEKLDFVLGEPQDGRVRNKIVLEKATYQENVDECSWETDGKEVVDGNFVTYFKDGSVHKSYGYSKGKPQGEWREFYPLLDNQKRQVLKSFQQFQKGALEGEQKRFWENGQLQVMAQYVAGVLHGRKSAFSEDGTRLFEATYEKGQLNGRLFQKRNDGTEVVQHFRANQPDGEYLIYYPTHPVVGRIKAFEAQYVHGKLEGEVIEYNLSGSKKVSSFYKAGLREGIATYYTDDGKVAMTAEFKENKQHGLMCSFFPNGTVSKESRFHNDSQEGEEVNFFQDGTRSSVKPYKNGKLHGICKEWNAKGVLVFEGEYFEGLRHGKFNKFFDDGRPHVLQSFDKDVLATKKTYP